MFLGQLYAGPDAVEAFKIAIQVMAAEYVPDAHARLGHSPHGPVLYSYLQYVLYVECLKIDS